MTIEVVLDSSAALAFIQNEPGGEVVVPVLSVAVMSVVNYAEVITKLIQNGAVPEVAQSRADALPVEVSTAGRPLAAAAGRLHARTRGTGVSLGDRFCLALADELGLPVLTSDRRWATLDLGVEVRLIR